MSLQLLIVLLTVALTSSAITRAAAPDIISRKLMEATNSTQDSRLIWSKKLEFLDLTKSTLQNGTVITNVTLTVFNRSAAMNKSINSQVLPGDWHHVESSADSLSCNLLMEQTQKLMAMLRFNREYGTF